MPMRLESLLSQFVDETFKLENSKEKRWKEKRLRGNIHCVSMLVYPRTSEVMDGKLNPITLYEIKT